MNDTIIKITIDTFIDVQRAMLKARKKMQLRHMKNCIFNIYLIKRHLLH